MLTFLTQRETNSIDSIFFFRLYLICYIIEIIILYKSPITNITNITIGIIIQKIIKLIVDSKPSDEFIPLNKSLKKRIILFYFVDII